MDRWLYHFMWYGIGPLVVILVMEHLVLTRIYEKQSSLQRLTRGLNANGLTDLAMWMTLRVPISSFSYVMAAVTVPGALVVSLLKLNEYVGWQGLAGGDPFGNFWLNLVVWYLIFDFGIYLAHVLMHRVPFFWEFHKLHHSATEMNIVTGTRVAFAERAFNGLISFGVLTLITGVPSPESAIALVVIREFVELLQHSDLPWDYGKVGYVLIGPRFHRMHHSDREDDYDSNFGNLFTIWDRLFGTVSHRYAELGSATADEIDCGLSEQENKHYGRWYFALVNTTIFHYGYLASRRTIRWARERRTDAVEPTPSP